MYSSQEMDMPEPIREGPVSISWKRSDADLRKVVTTFEIDAGKTEISPEKAAEINRAIVAILRTSLNVRLSKHR